MRRAKSQRPQGTRWLYLAGYAGLGVGCLLLGAITFLLVATPVDLVRDRLIEQVKLHTGRDLVVAGRTSLVFFPRVAISIADVALSAPPDMGGAPTLAVGRLEAELGLASLLTGQAGIKRLVLTRPAIELRIDAKGRRSWDVPLDAPRPAQAASTGAARPASAPVPQLAAGDGNLADAVESLLPASIRIVEGSVRYVDERSSLRDGVTGLDLDLTLDAGAGPQQAKGSFVWRGERVAVDGSLSSLRALVEQRRAKLSFKMAGKPIQASYDSTVEAAFALDRSGQALESWRVSLSGLMATLGASRINGALAIESRPARPYLSGSLNLSQLDLGGILIHPGPAQGAAASDRQPAQSAPAAAPQGGVPTPASAKRADGTADWSDDPIDLTPLGLVDADLSLSADRLLYKDVKTGPVRLSLQLANSVAKLTLEEMQLYGGRGRGVVTLDGRGQAPATTADLTLEDISAQPLLKDALGFDWLEGQSTIAIALAGQGTSERQIVSSLNGKLSLATNNGSIDGIDVDKALRGLEQARFGDLRFAPGEKTPFSELAGSFNIANGVADNKDLRLVSSSVRITGAGSFNLPARSLDYTVRPKVAAPSTGAERGVISLSNVDIPVRIEGSWEKPNFSVAGQERILEAVKEIGKTLKSKDVEDVLKGLLGGGDGQQKGKPGNFLEKLFKKP